MANPDRPNGYRPVGTLGGGPWQGLIRRGLMSDADGTAAWDNIYIGDPVQLNQDGNGALLPAAAADTDVVGVCVGVGYTPLNQPANESGMFNVADLEKRYGDASLVATQNVWIYYVPTSDVIFEIQSSVSLGSSGDIGLQLSHVLVDGSGTHGSTTTSQSSVELETDQGTADVIVVAHPEYVDNDMSLVNARYHVVFMDRAFHAATPDLA